MTYHAAVASLPEPVRSEMIRRMSQTSIHGYARMGAAARLTEIHAEVAAIREAFPELGGHSQKRRGPKAQAAISGAQSGTLVAPRRRRKLSAAARKAISEAQKKRWAEKRAG